ncbi:hypothetical protein [Arenibacter sp. F20364]|uniref:hypothetical protein n=1 Tax=Arenibacter sp. F20364 TaxID=2926415 RepID=UPI001FF28513|nr:hypothetical protein [Arenibacter sp. F20364]MCK0188540.1 hypothetical protein [Arenibacter sp. F20364]
MLYRFFSFIKFWLSSSNQHGVHSPFVYQYITKCLYTSPRFNSSKSHNILLKTIAYFKYSLVQLVPANTALEKEISKNLKGVSVFNPSSEIIFIDEPNKETVDEFIVQNKNLTNDTVILVNDIYKSEDTNKLWRSIKELQQVRVTIDLFYVGLVFFRREQVKQHFKIRI